MGTGQDQTVAPVTRGMVRKVQTTLQQNDDYSGQVDGVWGPMTEAGLRKWQQAHNLNANGEIDVATLQAMNIQPGSPNGQANNGAYDSNGNRRQQRVQRRLPGSTATAARTAPTRRAARSSRVAHNDAERAGQWQPELQHRRHAPHRGNYSSNNGNPPANMPYPTNQGNPNNNPNNTNGNGNPTH